MMAGTHLDICSPTPCLSIVSANRNKPKDCFSRTTLNMLENFITIMMWSVFLTFSLAWVAKPAFPDPDKLLKRIFLAASDIIMAPSSFPHVLCWWAAMAKTHSPVVGSPITCIREGQAVDDFFEENFQPDGKAARRKPWRIWRGFPCIKYIQICIEEKKLGHLMEVVHMFAWTKSGYAKRNSKEFSIFFIRGWTIGSWLDVKHDVLMFTHEQS